MFRDAKVPDPSPVHNGATIEVTHPKGPGAYSWHGGADRYGIGLQEHWFQMPFLIDVVACNCERTLQLKQSNSQLS